MTIDDAIKKNPFDPNKGNKSSYCRYLRYNVDGWYHLDSKEVYSRWQKAVDNEKEAEFHCGVEESGFHAYNCNDCPNKCEEWYQWDKEMKHD